MRIVLLFWMICVTTSWGVVLGNVWSTWTPLSALSLTLVSGLGFGLHLICLAKMLDQLP